MHLSEYNNLSVFIKHAGIIWNRSLKSEVQKRLVMASSTIKKFYDVGTSSSRTGCWRKISRDLKQRPPISASVNGTGRERSCFGFRFLVSRMMMLSMSISDIFSNFMIEKLEYGINGSKSFVFSSKVKLWMKTDEILSE